MQNFGQNISKPSILTELPLGNFELGEGFAYILNNMVVQSGITNPNAEPFDIVSSKWRELANKENKTQEDIKKLDDTFKQNVIEIAQSYLLAIAKSVSNTTGKIQYNEYEKFLFKYRFGHYNSELKPEYINKVKVWIKNAFDKISAHGELSGDNIIDKKDMAAYIYALTTKSKRDENGNFAGFEINGIITPEHYALCEANLFEKEENLFSVKLRIAYKVLYNMQ